MNAVTAMSTLCMLLFVVLVVTGGLLASPTRGSWLQMASTLFEDSAPSASLDCLKAQAAPTHPRAPPEHLGGLPWPRELASGWPKVEDSPLSTSRPCPSGSG